jgi:hypothetical protein
MPKHKPQKDPEETPNFITLLCSDETFQKHLTICVNSDFKINTEPYVRIVNVMDEDNLVLNAIPIEGIWLVNLNSDYYPHPFLEAR